MINLMSLDFVYKASIGAFESAIVNRKWNGIDTLELTLKDTTNADLFAINDIVWFNKELSIGFIVERIEEELTGSTLTRRIVALGLNSLLKDFITVPTSAYDTKTGTREAVVRDWVGKQVTRNTQYPIVLGDYVGLGDSITEQTRYKNLFDEVQRVLLPQDLGHNLTIDLDNEQFVFNVVEGTDRSVNASTYSPRVVFGVEYGNLADYKRTLDISSLRNYAFVGGQGEGAERTVVEVDVSDGRIKEVFVDARDIDVSADLEERGLQNLTDSMSVDSFEFSVIDRQFIYKINYDLGDLVTIVKSKTETENLQIKEVQEVYEKGRIQVMPSFGKSQKDLAKIMSLTNKRLLNLETNEGQTLTEIDGGGV